MGYAKTKRIITGYVREKMLGTLVLDRCFRMRDISLSFEFMGHSPQDLNPPSPLSWPSARCKHGFAISHFSAFPPPSPPSRRMATHLFYH
ncbi:hypothetical protein AVEN_202841-1 [Araneus ventricosus]|uniref:Uncharacterized protein n=1 Tax=Araneus ventricosus TaxID=182803 RepID=A0A4Y2DLK3_ARAVE|nr:hypothetical protein AVEN_202841-1 [Araneus ventricosus]